MKVTRRMVKATLKGHAVQIPSAELLSRGVSPERIQAIYDSHMRWCWKSLGCAWSKEAYRETLSVMRRYPSRLASILRELNGNSDGNGDQE